MRQVTNGIDTLLGLFNGEEVQVPLTKDNELQNLQFILN